MKLFSFVAIVVCAGIGKSMTHDQISFTDVGTIAQVLAVPLLVLPKDNRVVAIRLGHAIPNQPKGVGMGRKMRGPCRANRFNQKAVEVSNLFRQALGLPLIKPGSPDDDKVKIMPFIGTPPTFVSIGNKDIEGGNTDEHSRPHHAHAHGHHGHHRHLHHFGKGSFINRIHYSLMNLGRWEGRAVAFVLGETAFILPFTFILTHRSRLRNWSSFKDGICPGPCHVPRCERSAC